MPIIGSYSVPGPSASLTFTEEYNTLDELLIQLPDNSSNLIGAADIRDSVFTLWNRIDAVSLVASQSASFSVLYTNSNQVPVTVGGIGAGMSFSGTFSVQQMFDMLLYPYISPTSIISNNDPVKEFGSPTTVTLSWSANRNTNPITTIIVDGSPVLATGNNQVGSQTASATQDLPSSFSIVVGDGTATSSSTTTVSWSNKRYWGRFPSFGALNSAQILALDGAGVGTGNFFASSLVANYNGINGLGQYLVFAWPTSFGTPTFIVNGLLNTAFTKVNNALAFTNFWGYIENYDVWMSNTVQNSPITLFEIS